MSSESKRRVTRTIRPVAEPDSSANGVAPLTISDVLTNIDNRLAIASHGFRVIPTGFTPLDETLGGGLHGGDLFLLAGSQGTGKTTLALQMARNIAVSDTATALYLSFEHEEVNLLCRLLAMESALSEAQSGRELTFREVQRMFMAATRRGIETMTTLSNADPRLARMLRQTKAYQERLLMLRPSSRTTTVAAIAELVDRVQQKTGRMVVLFVDYLQKVPAEREFLSEGDRITWVTVELNELNIQRDMAVVAIAALDQDGLKAKRLHVHHLWGGSVLAYEADIIVMLAEKADSIARVYYEFSPQKVAQFRDWVVASLVKNRSGQNLIDMEFRKRFASSCFDPNGGFVAEKLVDEHVYRE